MSEKKLKHSRKNLMVKEAAYLYCKRVGLDIGFDDFIDNHYLPAGEGSELDRIYDNICKDLRCFRRIPGYELSEITVEEYEDCVDHFVNIIT